MIIMILVHLNKKKTFLGFQSRHGFIYFFLHCLGREVNYIQRERQVRLV